MSIIKTIKSTEYLQLHNKPAQTLTDLRSVGLLTHLMSLPETWEIRKTQLYKKFGRAAVTHAFKELEAEGYMVSIKYRSGKENGYKYLVSDVPITKEQVETNVADIEGTIVEISGVVAEVSILSTSQTTVDNVHLIKEIDKKETDINKTYKENLNLNPVDIYEILWDSALPTALKNRIKIMIASNVVTLTAEQIIQIEKAYNHQKSKKYIIPDCAADYPEAINDYEFANTVEKMLKSVSPISNMQGLIQKWTQTAYTYKKDEQQPLNFASENSSKLYDWLNE